MIHQRRQPGDTEDTRNSETKSQIRWRFKTRTKRGACTCRDNTRLLRAVLRGAFEWLELWSCAVFTLPFSSHLPHHWATGKGNGITEKFVLDLEISQATSDPPQL